MKVLVLGLGSIGTRHLNNLYRLGVSDLIAYRSRNLPPPQDILSKKVGFFTDLNAALAERPDGVVVANPTSLHLECALKAAQAGCHLYIEKPVASSLHGVERLQEVVQKKRLKVLVGCQLRYHPNLIAVEQWLKSFGQVFSVQADLGEWLPGWHPWEDYRDSYAAKESLGGGVILTLIHELDYLYWLFGKAKSVYGMGGHLTPLEVNVEDTALISFLFQNGITAQLRMDYWRKPAVRRFSIVGEGGEISWDYHAGRACWNGQDGVLKESSFLPSTWERNDLFLSSMQNFLKCIDGGETPRVALEDGVEVLRMAELAKQSIRLNQVISF